MNSANSAEPMPAEPTPPSPQDAEKQRNEGTIVPEKVSAFKGLGWLDRFLAVWILLAMIVGIVLGNFVSDVGPALQKGQFVGVSIPIGVYATFSGGVEDRTRSYRSQLSACW